MDAYFDFLAILLFTFALGCTLAFLPGASRMHSSIKLNTLFITAVVLTWLLWDEPVKKAWIYACCSLCATLNIYTLCIRKREKTTRTRHFVTDFIVYSIILMLSACIVAIIEKLPITQVVLDTHDDGSYTFIPGYWNEMLTTSIPFSFIATTYKHLYIKLLNKWKRIKSRQYAQLQWQKRDIETKFNTLQAQVNPHFLYNSLNSIAGLATIDGEKTRQMALALSHFFRYSINREQNCMNSLKNEAEMIQTYLNIEKIRFNESLAYHILLPTELESYQIPKMLLQPIVENCIKHTTKTENAKLVIDVSFALSSKGTLMLSVKDNGTPFPEDFVPGYGIQSIYEKLELLYPHDYNVELHTVPEKDFRIYLYHPKQDATS